MRKITPKIYFYLEANASAIISIKKVVVEEVFDSATEALNFADVETITVESVWELLKVSTEISCLTRRPSPKTIATNNSFVADLLKIISDENNHLAFQVVYNSELKGNFLYYSSKNILDNTILEQDSGDFILHPSYKNYIRKIVFK